MRPAATAYPSLDPDLAALLAAASPAAPLWDCTPEQARARVRAGDVLAAPGPAVAEVRDEQLGLVPVRVYRPAGEPVGTVVYLHGGGWVTGDLAYSDPLCRWICASAGVEVVSVDYRLAPEHPFPAALDDAHTVLRLVASRGGPVVLAGDSAGGALAAGCALRARDEGAPAIAGTLLLYPVMDADLTRTSYRTNAGLVLGPREMAWFWDHYVPDPAQRSDPLAAPLRAPDLHGLPPTTVVLAELDPLHDEGLAYARRLTGADVPTTLRVVPGLVHGFLRFSAAVPAAAAQLPALAADVRSLLLRDAAAPDREAHPS